MNDKLRKKSFELAVEIQIKELFWENKIYNNESSYLMNQKIINILSQLPNEPVENEYLKELFLRIEKKYLKDWYQHQRKDDE
mgnify:FL=1|tara:strand:+ start:244 stop:489 length:246 start_codon:yes stop_codon:yes gene_type:complete